MHLRVEGFGVLLFAWLLLSGVALAQSGTLTYRARVIHNNRAAMTVVNGTVDLARGDFEERVEESFKLDFRQMPAQMQPARDELPVVWGVGGRTAQRYGEGLPRYDSPLLRHFIVGKVLGGLDSLAEGQSHLNGQLSIEKLLLQESRYEIVCKLRGAVLVVVGSRARDAAGRWVPADMTVLGPSGELYQYQFDTVDVSAGPLAAAIELPGFDAQHYVTFPAGGTAEAPVRAVKDWLVFQAELPNGRPLNLIFDSGADTMIVDDMVLRFDSDLDPKGASLVDSGIGQGTMQAYDGFSFNVGGVEFRNLPVMGTQLTFAGVGADIRIHGIVGNELLQLCQLDIDLQGGTLHLRQPDSPEPLDGEKVPLRFIQQLPHIEAQVYDKGPSLFLLDTGQRQPLTVNLDYLSDKQLDHDLIMDGFMGDIGGSLAPRYMLEELSFSLGSRVYSQKTVGAAPIHSYDYEGTPVVGAIGFALLARHFGGLTFDYRRGALYLRNPGSYETFGRPKAWGAAALARADLTPQPPAVPVLPTIAAPSSPSEPAPVESPAADTSAEQRGFGELPAGTPLPEARQTAEPERAVSKPLAAPDTPRFNRMAPGAKAGGKLTREEAWTQLYHFAAERVAALSRRGAEL